MSTSTEVRDLLGNPDFGATPQATSDLERGVVDRRLVAALGVLTKEHRVCVDAFKKGHYFLSGVPDGPRIPKGYGKALGYGREEGWVLAPNQLKLHKDHIHVGYMDERGTHNTR
jgi:hypothetical protein